MTDGSQRVDELCTQEVWLSGVGVICGLGIGPRDVAQGLAVGTSQGQAVSVLGHELMVYVPPEVDATAYVLDRRTRDGLTSAMRNGIVAAGQALRSADLERCGDRLALSIATCNGERDERLDAQIVATARGVDDPYATMNRLLARKLRPTAFLSRLPNMLAAHISMLFEVTGPSRTFIGGAHAGVHAIASAFQTAAQGRSDLVLTGGVCSAQSRDVMIRRLPAAGSTSTPGELVDAPTGSAAAFLVFESARSARKRGAACLAVVRKVCTGPAAQAARLAQLAGASGTELSKSINTDSPSLIAIHRAGQSTSLEDLARLTGECGEASLALTTVCAALKLADRGAEVPATATAITRGVGGWHALVELALPLGAAA